jgi:hypothetical protein
VQARHPSVASDDIISTGCIGDVWSVQFGIRYTFNWT